MNCFELIKTVLDEAYGDIPGTPEERDEAIRAQMTLLTTEYQGLVKKGCIDYSDPARRFAYLFTYTTSHANIVYRRLSAEECLRDLFRRESVTVSCIGGGPGSDFLGILKHCLNAGRTPRLQCHLLDRDAAWGESWSDVGAKVAGHLDLTTHFNPFDVTEPAKWTVFKKHFQADLFTLIYFMSEVYALREKADAYFNELFSKMKKGALLLFVDNNSPSFRGWFDGFVATHGLTVLSQGATTMQMPLDEEKDSLEPYRSRLKRDPKLKADVAWRVIQR